MPALKATSYPKDKIKILLLENISDAAVQEMREAGYTNIRKMTGSVPEKELTGEIKGIHLLGIRSKTEVSAAVLNKADKLLAIGCYCIGVNQVDLKSATQKGIAVFNAPFSNTRSVAELVIGAAIMLIRRIPDKNLAAHQGIWLKDSRGSYELRGKSMGIIGYGNIGTQVSVLAESMGMNVFYYDLENRLPHGNAKQLRSVRELVRKADVLSLHVPADASTYCLINKELLRQAKKGMILINFSRGEVVDLEALKNAMDAGQVSGAAIDVYPIEPEKNSSAFHCVLQNQPNVLLTPHIGGSTEEAQYNIGLDVSSKLLNFLEKGSTLGSHTIPPLSLGHQARTHRILHIHRNVPGVLGEINSQLSSHGINILGQHLKTNDDIGYVVLDIDKHLSKEAFALLRIVKGTIRARLLY